MAILTVESWHTTRRAAALLGVSRRTLQRRAAAGLLETRQTATGETEYLLGGSTTHPPTDRATRANPMTHTLSHHDATPTTSVVPSPVGELVNALRDALHSAALAGVQRDAALAELDQVRAELNDARRRADLAESTATDLAAALRRRAVLVRDLARRVGELQAAVPRHGSTPSR